MDEMDQIVSHVRRLVDLKKEEEDYFLSLLQVRKIRKKQAVVQPGFVCKYRNFIAKGAMRAYLVDDAGQEHTVKLGIEGWWISDYNSYIYQRPATLFVEAMEDSVLVQLEYAGEQALVEKLAKFDRFFRIITQRGYAALQERLLATLSKSAEQRYTEFLDANPGFAQRIPQYVLASYLGMSTVYLSQLRNHRVAKRSSYPPRSKPTVSR